MYVEGFESAKSLIATRFVATTICGLGFLDRRCIRSATAIASRMIRIAFPSEVPTCALHPSFSDINVAGSRGKRRGWEGVWTMSSRRPDFRSGISELLSRRSSSLSTSFVIFFFTFHDKLPLGHRDNRFDFAVTGGNFYLWSRQRHSWSLRVLRDWMCCIQELKKKNIYYQ